ncbi:right-handed parallel beta-helix repeat-containing protein, partial [Thermodesulfobacteriota bacterium]
MMKRSRSTEKSAMKNSIRNHRTRSGKRKRPSFGPLLVCLLIFMAISASGVWTAFADTPVNTNITTDTTWDLAGSPYIIQGDIYVAGVGTPTLTIEPGVEVRFDPGTRLVIGTNSGNYGALIAQGTAQSQIRFTTNDANPAPGQWRCIYFANRSDDTTSIMEHCIVEYGGLTENANIYCYSASPTIRNCTISNSSGHGINLAYSSSPTIEGNTITDNDQDGINGSDNALPVISNNVINNNTGCAVNIYPNAAGNSSGNSGTGNGKNGICLRQGTVAVDSTWANQPLPYIIEGNVTVAGDDIATLTIMPGTELRFEAGTNLLIGTNTGNYGALIAQGTALSQIKFTTNDPSPAPGQWRNIYFHNRSDDTTSIMEHCIVEYGGLTENANIYCYSASPTIRNCTISNSSGHGINLAYSSSPTIEGNTITDNDQDGINGSDNALPVISNNVINNNTGCAVNIYPNAAGNSSGNSGTGNGKNGICLRQGTVAVDATWVSQPLPYIVEGNVSVSGEDIATLTIMPGAEVRFDPGTCLVIGSNSGNYGALIAQGTALSKIKFTTNDPSPQPGQWRSIYIHNRSDDATTILEHCIVEYGGSTENGNIYCYNSSPTIRNCEITNSSGHGIYCLDGSIPLIADNVFNNNAASAINLHPNRAWNTSGNSGSGNGENGIVMREGYVTTNALWKSQPLPYIASGNIYVDASPMVTLTLEPGVVLRFDPGTIFRVGTSTGNYGALIAQGTQAFPITFTSNSDTPAIGQWRGIFIHNRSDDAATILEHCTVEYGGNYYNSNIYLSNASPTIRYSKIWNSSHSGIYLTGNGCDNAVIECNNLKDNSYGIYTASGAQPAIHNNNFLNNSTNGVYNASSGVTVDAENNWWGDAQGPGFGGDSVYGDVDVTPWLTEASTCTDLPPTNNPPFVPGNPNPQDNAVNIPVPTGEVALSWSGGDPNPWDTVVYDVYFGESAETLTKVAENLTDATFTRDTLVNGITYFWKVVSRDTLSVETQGPVWRFTTEGPPPDLVVSGVTIVPSADPEAGQQMTFTAVIRNIGAGPVVDPFSVDFQIDGASIGTQPVSTIINNNETVELTVTWTARTGSHTLLVTADTGATVTESEEGNNTLSVALPEVMDVVPPVLVSTSPVNGDTVQEALSIIFTLNDAHSAVDDASVISSINVKDSGNQDVPSASITENNDVFTFMPAATPMADDTYQVSLTAYDTSGNTKFYTFSFTVDGQAPSAPTITGGTVTSGQIQARPAENLSDTKTVTLTGTREDNTSVWINNFQRVNRGSGDWSVELTLNEGANELEIWLVDAADNRGDSVFVDIIADTAVPAFTGMTPGDDSYVSVPPAQVVIESNETASGLDLNNSTHEIFDGTMTPVGGTWTKPQPNQLVFTPSSALGESAYTLNIQLVDRVGRTGAQEQYHFTVDQTPPPDPAVNPVTTPANNPVQTISGTKEAYASILMNGGEVVGNTPETTWQYTVTLAAGPNQFIFAAKDRAGNQSGDVTIDIIYEDVPPLPVDTLNINEDGDGTTVALDWTGYNEAAHGDIDLYRIYRETAVFSGVTGLTPIDTVDNGTFTYTASSLARNTDYWFAVVAVDSGGQADPNVTAVQARARDIVAPDNPANLGVTCYSDHLVFNWDHSGSGDLAGYLVYPDGAASGTTIPATQNQFDLTTLSPSTAHTFKVTAFDNDGNESSGIERTGHTLLPNPTGLSAVPQSGYVDLSWNPVVPAEYLKEYRVYRSENPFASVESMTPAIVVSKTSTQGKVAGLTNNVEYHFAVTAVNLSDGEEKTVTTITATPVPDTEGPVISDVKVNNAALTQGHTIDVLSHFTLDAQDPAGVSRVEFHFDNTLHTTDYSGSPLYECEWDISQVTDGPHTLMIAAFDSLGSG